jgi:hypothetical protein
LTPFLSHVTLFLILATRPNRKHVRFCKSFEKKVLIMEKKDWQAKGEGHRQRLREKFQQGGLERFSDEEVIEFLLTLGTPRKDVKTQAREALRRFGSLSGVLSAPGKKLLEIKGIWSTRLQEDTSGTGP